MRKLGTIDLEILQLAINQNETFNETHLENSKLKRHGVGKILDTLASLKDRKFISMNDNGSFTITELAKEILWSSKIPIWAKILRLLQIKSCDLQQIIETINSSEEKIFNELEQLRKNQLVLMSPQRQDEKLIKVYEILPEGIEVIDETETHGFENINFGKNGSDGEIIGTIDEIINKIQKLNCSDNEKNNIIQKLELLKNKLEI
jgi:DNA-binding PadR family transcriptional regulator